MNNKIIIKKLELLGESFKSSIYQDDEAFLDRIAGLEESNRKRVLKFKKWDWFHGVGLYGYWKHYEFTKDKKYLDLLENYYVERIQEGLPEKNINSVSPMLTLTYLYEETNKQEYLLLIEEWAEWIQSELPKTSEGGFQHITSESDNTGQLWDDTLFMTVLFLARAGVILQNETYIEEAKYQFLIHIKYLVDRETGLWYHGWTFEENHNYGKALWARGNCWITIAITEFIEITHMKNDAVKKFLVQTLNKQIQAIAQYQDGSGLWHTIVNESDNYLEASGSAGFAYGILKAVDMGLVDRQYLHTAIKPLNTLLALIDNNGMVHQVSIGTPMGQTVDFYKNIPLAPMAYGQALTMLYLIQMLKQDEKVIIS